MQWCIDVTSLNVNFLNSLIWIIKWLIELMHNFMQRKLVLSLPTPPLVISPHTVREHFVADINGCVICAKSHKTITINQLTAEYRAIKFNFWLNTIFCTRCSHLAMLKTASLKVFTLLLFVLLINVLTFSSIRVFWSRWRINP